MVFDFHSGVDGVCNENGPAGVGTDTLRLHGLAFLPRHRAPHSMSHWQELLRDVPDFPRPGILFKDITPVLADAEAFAAAIAQMA